MTDQPTPDLRTDTIWSYKGKDYRIIKLTNELIQDENGNWVPMLKYTTVRWTGLKFNRAWTDFVRKFERTEPTQKKSFKINTFELQVLMGMNENTVPQDHWSMDGGFFYSFKAIQGYSGIPMEKVRRTVRSLARKGLMEYCRGLMTEMQEAAGAGYRITDEGREYVKEITKTRLLSS
jgi:DNA-binding MarR family transcriptional regulator